MSVKKEGTKIEISQTKYMDSLQTIPYIPNSDPTVELSDERLNSLRRVIGSLGWLSTRTRPDIAYSANASAIKDDHGRYTETLIHKVNKCVKYLWKTRDVPFNLVFHGVEPRILVYSDSAFANNSDFSSQCGYLIFLSSGASRNLKSVSLLDWKSTKVKRVTDSTLSSETLALSKALDQAVYIQHIFRELTGQNLPIIAYTDCRSLVDALYSDKQMVLSKRLLIDVRIIRELLDSRQVSVVEHIPTSSMLADCLTKLDANKSKQSLLSVLRSNQVSV